MRDPAVTLTHVQERWQRLAKRFAGMERHEQYLRSEIARLSDKVEELEAELLRLRPRDTKWGWLWWTLMRPEVIHVRVNCREGQSPKYTRNAIYANISSAWKHTGFDASIHHVGGYVWDVSRGRGSRTMEA